MHSRHSLLHNSSYHQAMHSSHSLFCRTHHPKAMHSHHTHNHQTMFLPPRQQATATLLCKLRQRMDEQRLLRYNK